MMGAYYILGAVASRIYGMNEYLRPYIKIHIDIRLLVVPLSKLQEPEIFTVKEKR
jgi:hypothetical protein